MKEKRFVWIISLNSYFKQKWLEKLLSADGKGCLNQGQFYLRWVERQDLTERKKCMNCQEQMEMEK